MENSEITVDEEDELLVLDQLEEEEEPTRQVTFDEMYDPEETEPTELEEMFPDAPYTVYYQDQEE